MQYFARSMQTAVTCAHAHTFFFVIVMYNVDEVLVVHRGAGEKELDQDSSLNRSVWGRNVECLRGPGHQHPVPVVLSRRIVHRLIYG